MKKLSRNESIAVFTGIALLAYLFFSGPIVNLFSNENNSTTTQMPQTGFQAQDSVAGQGDLAQRGDTVTVHYVGRLTNGQVFDSSRDANTPFTFTLGRGDVIRGWDEGLEGMRVGGKRTLTIAPDFAYGSRGIGPIPPNSTLIFEVELLDVEKAGN